MQSRRHTTSVLFIAATVLLLCLPVSATAGTWTELSTTQQEALAPLQSEWNTMSEKQHRYYLKMAKRYPTLTPKQKQRMLKRLKYWSSLTPKQREQARQTYQAFKKVPKEKREQVKEMAREQEANKAAASTSPDAAEHHAK